MRVLHLHRTWAMGGAETILLSFFRHLPRFGIEQFFLPYRSAKGADEEFTREAARTGIRIVDPALAWNGLQDWRKTEASIIDTIRRESIDIVHTHDNQSNTLVGFCTPPCARIASAYGWWDRTTKLKLYYAIERRFALPRFDRIYTVSETMKRRILTGGAQEGRVRVVHTGLEAAAFRDTEGRSRFRAEHDIASDALVIGTVSRLAPEKGQRYLLRAAASVARAVPETIVLIVGKGPERTALEQEAEQLGITEKVRFAGYVENIRTALESMDIFALASTLDEGFPTCLLEAQAAGLPVVATDIGGTRETIEPGTTGLLAAPADTGSLATALHALAIDTERRRAMAEAGRCRATRHFTVDRMARETAVLYRESLDDRRAK